MADDTLTMCENKQIVSWNPARIFAQNDEELKFALIILNQPILSCPDLVLSLWKRATLRVTVDGGTDRWLNFLQEHKFDEQLTPDLITGDLDSVTPAALDHFSNLGATITKTPDQNETDFTKALRQIVKWQEQKNIEVSSVITLVETAGRLDHIIANLNTLFLARKLLQYPVYQLASNSISWLLNPGEHSISVPKSLAQGHCSLSPIGAPSTQVTTTGLKWNLNNQCMQFGLLVSTSNAFSNTEGGEVTIDTNGTLVWTIEVL